MISYLKEKISQNTYIYWIINTNFYSLHYSNNEKAVNLIKKLK